MSFDCKSTKSGGKRAKPNKLHFLVYNPLIYSQKFFFSYRCVLLRVGRESLSTTRIKIKKLKRGHFSVNEKSQEYLFLISVAGNPNDWQ